ncbi:MAG: NAD-dependent epimerase/dehydratase family protein [Oligoflexia bacterium]|nr:NAD-dependent epimerase/dehydratase family protein [Oligoflexia bacterium]
MRILVTGGTGFIGNAIISRILQEPELEACCLTRNPSSGRAKLPARVQLLKGDVTNKSSLPLMQSFDVIIHCVQFPNHPVQNPSRGYTYEKYDAEGTENLIAHLKEQLHRGLKRFIYISGAGTAAGKSEPWFKAKWRAEEAIRKSGFPFVIVRPSWVYGPGDKSMSKFIAFAKLLPFMPVLGDGQGRVSPLFVNDLSEIVFKCLRSPEVLNQTIEVGGPENLKMEDIQKQVLRCLGKSKPLWHQPIALLKPLSGMMAAVLPTPPLSPEALDFITMDAPVTNSSIINQLGIQLTKLPEGLARYAVDSSQ